MGTSESWTPERRIRQRQAIQRNRPWEKSTGPRTNEGKAIASQNANRSAARILAKLEKLEDRLARLDLARLYGTVPSRVDAEDMCRDLEKQISHLENKLRFREMA